MAQTSVTKSIDVGSMFLMDLSVNDSDEQSPNEIGADVSHSSDVKTSSNNSQTDRPHNLNIKHRKTMARVNYNQFNECKPTYFSDHHHIAAPTIPQSSEYLGSSLDRIASVINCDDEQQGDFEISNEEHSATIIDGYNKQSIDYYQEPQSSYSLSDESFVASSGTSLTSASYSAHGSESEDCDDNKDCITTREDSGVLDMKDLEGPTHSSLDFDNDAKSHHVDESNKNHNFNQGVEQKNPKKPISDNIIMATNLINKSEQNDNYNYQQVNYISKNHLHRLDNPTEGCESNNNSTNNHNNRRPLNYNGDQSTTSNHNHARSRRSISASLPIQVPARQMRKDINKMKLKLMKEEDQQFIYGQMSSKFENSNQLLRDTEVIDEEVNQSRPAWDDEIDDDAFLDQEYNKNHHNHYPIDEHDDEHLRAGDDPMRLFASIQALARSLHEDAELFGSLPPKRLLESPVRSIALV